MKRITASLAVATAVLLVASSASAAGTSIDSFGATVGATTINIAGTASFVDEATTVGVDATPDATNHGKVPGTDITTAEISRPNPTANALRFRMNVANQPPQLNGLPFVPYFAWDFGVDTPSGGSLSFLLLAVRASGENADADPDFVLWTCDPTAPPPNCNQTASLTGAFTATGVDVNVPVAAIGAVPGAVIHGTGTNNIRVSPGIGTPVASGITNLLLEGLTHTEDYTVPGPTVQVGLAPAGTAPEDVTLTKAGTFKTDGSFTATLPRPEAGSYVVAARVCYTAADCALTSTDVTL